MANERQIETVVEVAGMRRDDCLRALGQARHALEQWRCRAVYMAADPDDVQTAGLAMQFAGLFESVPEGEPGAGCTTIPAGLSITIRSASHCWAASTIISAIPAARSRSSRQSWPTDW